MVSSIVALLCNLKMLINHAFVFGKTGNESLVILVLQYSGAFTSLTLLRLFFFSFFKCWITFPVAL